MYLQVFNCCCGIAGWVHGWLGEGLGQEKLKQAWGPFTAKHTQQTQGALTAKQASTISRQPSHSQQARHSKQAQQSKQRTQATQAKASKQASIAKQNKQ